jgi:acetyltransferase-like isoleucine patch superfamily enzyme
VILQAEERIEVGDLAGLGERTSLIDSDHDHDGGDRSFWELGARSEPVVVGRNAWVGANSVILRGARVGRNSVVGAGSVVTAGDHPPGWLIVGAPARAIRALGQPN